MSTVTFDTHNAIKKLQSAGAYEKLAEAVVSTIQQSFDDRVATRSDIAAVKGEIAGLRANTSADIANLKVQLILWIAAFNGIAIAILKLIL